MNRYPFIFTFWHIILKVFFRFVQLWTVLVFLHNFNICNNFSSMRQIYLHVDNYICEDFFSRLFLFNCIQISKISSSPFYYRFCFVMDMKCTKTLFINFLEKIVFYFTKIMYFSSFYRAKLYWLWMGSSVN